MAPTDKSWAIYEPDAATPWDWHRVAHLHRRAGFAATYDERQRDLKDGPKASLDRLLTGRANLHEPAEFEKTARLLGEAAASERDPARLKAWWCYRMTVGPDPLTERLTLMWHNHFATSNAKVNNLALMYRQNETLRRLARAPFGDLLNAVVRDPAMLIWLDAPSNRKGKPNENLARELMELFSLGIGPYTETDVKEAARALTGWGLDGDEFAVLEASHDSEPKTILGQRGHWKGEDLVRLVLEHPATARRIAWRLCDTFFGEKALKASDLDALADGLRQRNLDVGWAVETILRSRLFFAEANIGTQVRGPVEFVIGACRSLELFEPSASTLMMAEWTARLGQDLFYPPNVGGWTGGRGWLTTRSLIGRTNFAAALVGGQLFDMARPIDVLALVKRHQQGQSPGDVIDFSSRLLLGREPNEELRRLLVNHAKRSDLAEVARQTVALVLSTPEAQLN